MGRAKCSRRRRLRETETDVRWFVLCLLTVAHLAQAEPVTGIDGEGRQRLERFLSGLQTIAAEFRQRVLDEEGAEIEVSTGRVLIEKPGRFAWTYREPYAQTIVSDGRTLWLYDEDLAQVTVNAVDADAAGSAAGLLGGDVELDYRYTVEELGTRDGLRWVRLLPKAQGGQYAAIEMGLDAATLTTMRLTDNLGQVTELTFSAIERNPPLDPATFRFEIPPGVDVVTGVAPD